MTKTVLVPGLLLAVSAVVTVGCGGGNTEMGPPKQKTVPVTGIVKYKGKPVPRAGVSFQSIDGKVSANASTDGAGTFILSTYGRDDGAPPGQYKVIVAASGAKEIEPGVLDAEPEGGFKSPVPAKYGSPATTDIVVEVKAEGTNHLTIDLK
jgi:hypothetical protein